HVDPKSTLTWVSGGNARFASGVPVFIRAVSGHRDTGFTTCPGAALYSQLDAIAQQAQSDGLPKLYAPSVRGALGGQVRFRARLSEPLPWTVTVADATGTAVATGTGTSQDVDWTWDAATAVPGSYSWTISAGDNVRPASGTIGGKPVSLAITSATALPLAVSPNGDGVADTITFGFQLAQAASVKLEIAQAGKTLASVYSADLAPGAQTVPWGPTGLKDGKYAGVLTATNDVGTVTHTVLFRID